MNKTGAHGIVGEAVGKGTEATVVVGVQHSLELELRGRPPGEEIRALGTEGPVGGVHQLNQRPMEVFQEEE